MGKVVLITSGKGGVGKTTITTNLGVSLAKQGVKTLILDMNMGLRNDDIYLGLQDSILFDFGDVLTGMCKLEKAIVKHDYVDNLCLLSCPQYREIEGLSAEHIHTIYSKLKNQFDVVLVDCPLLSGNQIVNLTFGADSAVVVLSQDYVAMRNGDAINRKLGSLGIFDRKYVVNKILPENYGNEDLPDLMTISKSMESLCLGVVPFDNNIHISNNIGEPISSNEESYLSKTFDEMAKRLWGK